MLLGQGQGVDARSAAILLEYHCPQALGPDTQKAKGEVVDEWRDEAQRSQLG